MAALRLVQASLGLDYGGIDFGLNRQGEVLLFEANATMVVEQPNGDERWDYRRAAVKRIHDAVRKLFLTNAVAAHRSLTVSSQLPLPGLMPATMHSAPLVW